mmetsp:Transcript_4312/g.14922  ORF Transcript_4312/g.14922 Transcript_4312/m.14922 type:complete len:210 (-) Transcript_4312:29-658(-)
MSHYPAVDERVLHAVPYMPLKRFLLGRLDASYKSRVADASSAEALLKVAFGAGIPWAELSSLSQEGQACVRGGGWASAPATMRQRRAELAALSPERRLADADTRRRDPQRGFRCAACQMGALPTCNNLTEVSVGAGCYVHVGDAEVGHYSIVSIASGPPPYDETNVRTLDADRYSFRACACVCHTTACGDVAWMQEHAWVTYVGYDSGA